MLLTKHTSFCFQKAKTHVEQEYATVGMLEDLPNFFKTMEYIFPKHFSGAYSEYLSYDKRRRKSRHSTKGKITPQESTTQTLRRKLKYEMEFYSFVRQRFYGVLDHINKQNGTLS